MCRRLFVVVLLWSLSIAAHCGENLHTLWLVKGNHNTVYLLGSVHALKGDDSALPPEALSAYASAKALVMEINPVDTGANILNGSVLDLETLPAGQTLAAALGPDVYSEFAAHVKRLGLDPEFLSHFQPWFAAMMLNQLELAKLGFDSGAGVDHQLAERALTDHKKIIGLETIEEQMEIFAHLSLEDQRQYMMYSLSDLADASGRLDAVVSAWRRGDTKGLEQLLSEGLKQSPDLYRKLTTDRNRKWLPAITRLLNDDHDYLVVVGALHLVGKDGIVNLLQRHGYEVAQH